VRLPAFLLGQLLQPFLVFLPSLALVIFYLFEVSIQKICLKGGRSFLRQTFPCFFYHPSLLRITALGFRPFGS